MNEPGRDYRLTNPNVDRTQSYASGKRNPVKALRDIQNVLDSVQRGDRKRLTETTKSEALARINEIVELALGNAPLSLGKDAKRQNRGRKRKADHDTPAQA